MGAETQDKLIGCCDDLGHGMDSNGGAMAAEMNKGWPFCVKITDRDSLSSKEENSKGKVKKWLLGIL